MVDVTDRVQDIDALLPQTQCRQCGYAGCRPYAQALANGSAQINQCPPGGDQVVHELAAFLSVPYQPVDPRFGVTKPTAVALIDEATCIGCTLCIQACPVDAIVGAAKLMHTVIAAQCTGCELCIPPCPVDCIQMLADATPPTQARRRAAADRARLNFERRDARLSRSPQGGHPRVRDLKALTVQRAVERGKARLAQRQTKSKLDQ